MIIKRLEIISFGKFSNKVIEFSDGLNIIFGNNESGKSTVISFIYAMFYGFGDNRGKTLSLREKYTPWSGGICDGKITVHTDDGKNICIYRKAGNVKKYDILRVYDLDTGEEYNTTPEDIIGVGQDTFFKTICIKQLSSAFEGNNDEITQRLSNIASGGDEAVNYEKAQKILEGIRREIQPQRGQGGELTSITNKLAEAQRTQMARSSLKTELQSLDTIITQTENEVSRLTEKESILKDKDCTLEIARIQGRLEEMQKKTPQKGNTAYSIAGLLCLVLSAVAMFLDFSFFYLFLPLSLVFFAIGFIKRNPSANNNLKDTEAELQRLIEKKKISDKEKEAVSNAFNEARKRLEELKIRKESISLSLSEESADTYSLTEKKKRLEAKLRSVTISMEALKRAHENMQKNFTPALNKKASEYFSYIAGGKYSRIFCDKEFGVMIEEALPRESGFFSGGTVDQLYLSVRLALTDMLYGDESCPILLDQPFLQYDKVRKERAIKLLANLPHKRQILLFTSDESLISTNKATEILT